jgi:undecaprenyl-diphosphatase
MALRPFASSSRRGGHLSVGQAVVLGLIQGPTEVLPVSSSGHLVLVPALLDWPYARLPADVRKAFEVALHTGAGLALLWLLRNDVVKAARDPLGTALLAAPAAGIALGLEDRIERKASHPSVAARAQIAAGIALAAADYRKPPKGSDPLPRLGEQLVVGLAQAAALVPGVSRNGATLTAARALGLDREAAARISWRAGLPIIGGATLLKLVRLRQRGLDPDLRVPFAAGAAAAFASTLVASPLLRVRRQRATAAYRVALGAFALHRLEWPRG